MTSETDTQVLNLIEKLDQKMEKLDQKLEKFIDTTSQKFENINQKFENLQKDLTDIKVGQARLEGEAKILQLVNSALFISFLGAVIKFVFFPNP